MKRQLGWVALAAGLVVTAGGLVPARASVGAGVAGEATGSAAPTSTTTVATSGSAATTTSSGPTTTSTMGSGATTTTSGSTTTTTSGPTTTTAEATSSTTTTTTLTTSAPTGPGRTTTSAPPPTPDPAGVLSISAPDLTYLGATGRGGRVLSARLGTVTVTDTRGLVDGVWTARVSATAFATGASSAGERLARSAIHYWSGPATASSGTALLAPGQRGPADAVPLTSTRVAFSATGVTGPNSASWVPTVVIWVPPAAVAGRYQGAIIHSVA
jgi:hypothetical protein